MGLLTGPCSHIGSACSQRAGGCTAGRKRGRAEAQGIKVCCIPAALPMIGEFRCMSCSVPFPAIAPSRSAPLSKQTAVRDHITPHHPNPAPPLGPRKQQ